MNLHCQSGAVGTVFEDMNPLQPMMCSGDSALLWGGSLSDDVFPAGVPKLLAGFRCLWDSKSTCWNSRWFQNYRVSYFDAVARWLPLNNIEHAVLVNFTGTKVALDIASKWNIPVSSLECAFFLQGHFLQIHLARCQVTGVLHRDFCKKSPSCMDLKGNMMQDVQSAKTNQYTEYT